MPTHAPQTTLYRVLYVHPYCTSYCIQNQRTESVMESPLWKWILIDSVKKPFYPGLAFAFSTYHLVASLGRVLLGLASLVFWCTYVRSAYFERRTLVFCDLLEFWEFTPLYVRSTLYVLLLFAYWYQRSTFIYPNRWAIKLHMNCWGTEYTGLID